MKGTSAMSAGPWVTGLRGGENAFCRNLDTGSTLSLTWRMGGLGLLLGPYPQWLCHLRTSSLQARSSQLWTSFPQLFFFTVLVCVSSKGSRHHGLCWDHSNDSHELLWSQLPSRNPGWASSAESGHRRAEGLLPASVFANVQSCLT